jgi:hypothetical protein
VGIAKSLYVGTGISGALNGTVGATTPSTGAFTTLSATGTITSTKDGVLFERSGVTTLAQQIHVANTGSDCYFGAEKSGGSGILNGSTSYAFCINQVNNTPVQIGSNNVVVATFKQGSSLALENATTSTGCGITFPATQSASTDANTLDDYEEGTWTPSLKFGGASVGMTGTFEGYYTKIGRLISCQGRMILSAKGSSTGAATLALPFTSAATNTLPGMSVGYYESWASSITASCYINSGSALLQLTNLTGTTVGALTDTNFTNATRCDFSFSYIV